MVVDASLEYSTASSRKELRSLDCVAGVETKDALTVALATRAATADAAMVTMRRRSADSLGPQPRPRHSSSLGRKPMTRHLVHAGTERRLETARNDQRSKASPGLNSRKLSQTCCMAPKSRGHTPPHDLPANEEVRECRCRIRPGAPGWQVRNIVVRPPSPPSLALLIHLISVCISSVLSVVLPFFTY